MKKTIALSAIITLAGFTAVHAEKTAGHGLLMSTTIDGTTTVNPPGIDGVPDTTVSVDVTGQEHWDDQGDPSNTVLNEVLGEGAMMTGVGWNVTIATIGGSWFSEAVVYFDGADLDGSGLFLTPGAGEGAPGTMNFQSGGILDLSDNGVANIPILADGILYMELFESFDDVADAADSEYIDDAGIVGDSIYDIAGFGIVQGGPPVIEVPTASTVGLLTLLLGLAAFGVYRLRR
jgi:hypothetical protein